MDLTRQIRLIRHYQFYLCRMYNRLVSIDEAGMLWVTNGYAKKYRDHHPFN